MSTLKSINVIHPSGTTNNIVNDASGNVTIGAALTAGTVTSPSATALTIQSAGTTAMTIDTSGNVGIGTATPFTKLTVSTSYTNAGIAVNDGTVNTILYNSAGGVSSIGTTTNHPVQLYSNNAARVTIDTSGNVGIGTSTITARLQIKGAAGGATSFKLENSDASRTYGIVNGLNTGTDGILSIFDYTASAPRFNIDASGNVLVGGTTQRNAAKQTIEFTTGNNGLSLYCVANTNAVEFVDFYANSGNLCGSISRVGTTSAVAYNVSSDYRLKHDIKPMELGLETIEKLKPVTYKWNEDNSFGEGFIAHELQEIIPFAVNGTKDAVNENGSIKTQGVDYSKIVVHLVKAIQELSAKNDALEARLAKLETVQ